MRGGEVVEEILAAIEGEDLTCDQIVGMMLGSGFRDGLTGARSLVLGVVEMAIADLTNAHPRNAKRREDARRWFQADYHSSRFPDVKTFEGCCESLGLNPSLLRPLILAMEPRASRRKPMNHVVDGVFMRHRRRPRVVPLGRAA